MLELHQSINLLSSFKKKNKKQICNAKLWFSIKRSISKRAPSAVNDDKEDDPEDEMFINEIPLGRI